MTTPSMSRDAADEILAGLGAAHDRVAAAMFAIDSHPGLGFLRGSVLSGGTAARWRSLQPEVDLLWAHFAVLGDRLERARAIRGQRRPGEADWAELARLLREPTVGLDADGLPVDGTGGVPVTQVRLWDLAHQLEQRCAGVAALLAEVDASWSATASRLAPLTEAVDAAGALAAELGEAEAVGDLRRLLDRLQELHLGDPLSAAPGGRLTDRADAVLAELTAEVTAVRDRLAGLAALRDGHRQRIGALRGQIDELAAAEAAVADAYAQATEKIAEPGLPPPPAAAAVLRTRIAALDRLALAARWREFADDLATAGESVRQARQRADELRAAADGLLARRAELRGRLDAYRAKAAARGLAEHDELTEKYAHAHRLLYAAPCDLRGATRAVFAYQQTLASVLEESR